MNPMEKLKPCPFCGGKAYFDVQADTARKNAVEFTFKIRCKKCRTPMPSTYGRTELWLSDDGDSMFGQDKRQQAIDTWNRRVESDV